MVQPAVSRGRQGNTTTVPIAPSVSRITRVRKFLNGPYSIIRHGFQRLKTVLQYPRECPCPTCRRRGTGAHRDEPGPDLPDEAPPAYSAVDPNPPAAPGQTQRQRAARENHTNIAVAPAATRRSQRQRAVREDQTITAALPPVTTPAAPLGGGGGGGGGGGVAPAPVDPPPAPPSTSGRSSTRRARDTPAPSHTETTATAPTAPNRSPNRNSGPTTASNANVLTAPAPAFLIATVEEETTRLRALRATIADEERNLRAIRRRHAALERSILNARIEWHQEFERSYTAHQLSLRALDNLYRFRIPDLSENRYNNPARQMETFFRRGPGGKP